MAEAVEIIGVTDRTMRRVTPRSLSPPLLQCDDRLCDRNHYGRGGDRHLAAGVARIALNVVVRDE